MLGAFQGITATLELKVLTEFGARLARFEVKKQSRLSDVIFSTHYFHISIPESKSKMNRLHFLLLLVFVCVSSVGCGTSGPTTEVPVETDRSAIEAEEAAGEALNNAGKGGGV